MSKAIKEGRLCKYYYYPKLAYLNDGEMRLYSRISKRLAQLWDSENGKFKNKQEAEMLLMNRKRIIHKCSDKLNVFREIISEIGKDDLRYTFVYAPQGKYEKMGIDDEVTLTEEDDMSFIQRLLNEAKMMYPNKRCNTFTGMDSKDKRSLLLKSFADGNLDILFAMKCLDEGVDIPRAERGIFTSSTGNPREFIQRRGRLLRNHPDKMFSYIYDIVVIPATINREDSFGQMERNMVKSELKRVAYYFNMKESDSEKGNVEQHWKGNGIEINVIKGSSQKLHDYNYPDFQIIVTDNDEISVLGYSLGDEINYYMDGKEIFKEILKSPQMKELLGVSPGEEIHEDYESSSQHPEISVVQSIIDAQIRHTSDDALFKNIKKIFDL